MATATIAPSGAPLDTAVRLVTPERIAFEYPLAGPFHRVCSCLIDVAVLTAFFIIASIFAMLVTLGTSASQGIMYVLWWLILWFYGAICEATFNGQTIGKWAIGLRVVSTKGVPISGGQAMIRNLLGAVEGPIPFLFLPAIASMVMTSRFQRLGDLAAGTMVIIERRPKAGGVPRPREAESTPLLPLMPATIPAGSELSRGLSDYVKRRGRFSKSRREEIARPLAEPFRRRYALPPSASGDAILCALYRRIFLGD